MYIIKKIIYHLYSKIYHKIFYKIQQIAENFFSYEYSYNHLIKKIDKENILTKKQKQETKV